MIYPEREARVRFLSEVGGGGIKRRGDREGRESEGGNLRSDLRGVAVEGGAPDGFLRIRTGLLVICIVGVSGVCDGAGGHPCHVVADVGDVFLVVVGFGECDVAGVVPLSIDVAGF